MENKRKQLWQAVKFTLFSASAGIIQVGSFALLEIFIRDYWIPHLISLILSIIWNFTLNRRYTFKSVANVPVAMAKVFGFYLVFTPVSTYLGNLAEQHGVNDFLILVVTMLAKFALEFLFCCNIKINRCAFCCGYDIIQLRRWVNYDSTTDKKQIFRRI